MGKKELIFKQEVLKKLPLGSIKPEGWLKDQLQIQADGLTGHIDEFWEDLGKDNKWLGGNKEGWERGPYYADGLIPLAYLLDNGELKKKAQVWIEAFLKQDKEGWIGPQNPAEDRYSEYDPWPIFVVLKVLSQYYEVSEDKRVIEVMTNFFKFLKKMLKEKPLFDWGKFRSAELILSIHWLYKFSEEDWLLELAELVHKQGYNWADHFNDFKYTKKSLDIKFETHVVNNAMGIKAPAVRYRQSGKEKDLKAVYKAIDNLDKFHGQVSGVFSGDEHLSGKNPSQGTELCAVVEYMFSLEKVISIIGDPIFADRLEKITFNALPATMTPDMWAHQYDQQANQAVCSVAERDWTNNPDANIYGLEPNFGCCTANMHQGWPKFVQSLWMKTENPKEGLTAVAYSPCTVQSKINNKTIKIKEESNYPFAEEIKFTLEMDKPIEFPLRFRIPQWAEKAKIILNDGTVKEYLEKGFIKLEREWNPGDVIKLYLEMEVKTEYRHLGAVSLQRGPLVYSLKIGEEWKQIGGIRPHADWEVYPTTPWNFALELNLSNPEKNLVVNKKEINRYPFSPQNTPVEIKIKGQQISDWRFKNNWVGPIPNNLIKKDGKLAELTLIPYGATNLRISEFPVLYDN